MNGPVKSTAEQLSTARAVESLVGAARDLMVDAQIMAEEDSLKTIAKWIEERVHSLEDELLKEIRAKIEALEKSRDQSQGDAG